MESKLGVDQGTSCQDLLHLLLESSSPGQKGDKNVQKNLEIKHAFVLDLVVGEVVNDVRESATVGAVLRVEGMVIRELVIVGVPLEHLRTGGVEDVLVAGVLLLDVLRLGVDVDVIVAVLILGENITERFFTESITSI